MAFEQVTMKVSPGVYQRLNTIKDTMAAGKQRQVTMNEALEELARAYEMLLAAADAKEAP